MADHMQQAINRILLFHTGQDMDDSSDEGFLAAAHAFLLDPKQFRAGNIKHHLPAWQQLFAKSGTSHKAHSVLQWIEHGVSFDFVHPHSVVQQSHPRFQERLKLVANLLCNTVGDESVDALLDCDTSRQVHFATRVSCTYYIL